MEAFTEEILKGALASNRAKLAPPSFYDAFMGFIHAIRWDEPWMVGIVSFHVLLLAIIVLSRRMQNVQLAIFVVLCAVVFAVRYINEAFRSRWQELGFTQNYFDKNGVFISFVFSLPLLLIGMIQMLYALYMSGSLLIIAKRMEHKQQQLAKKSAETKSKNEPASASGGEEPKKDK